METAVGAKITRTSARTLYWTVATDKQVTSAPQVALLGPRHSPTTTTQWYTATWHSGETVTGEGTEKEAHTRTLRALVAGPEGPTIGAPLVAPAPGEYSTWVRLTTNTDTMDLQGALLEVQ